jgi:hypothetical protein
MCPWLNQGGPPCDKIFDPVELLCLNRFGSALMKIFLTFGIGVAARGLSGRPRTIPCRPFARKTMFEEKDGRNRTLEMSPGMTFKFLRLRYLQS